MKALARFLTVASVVACAAQPSPARAASLVDLTDLSGLTQLTAAALLVPLAITLDYRALMPASSLAPFPGFEIGVDGTFFPQDFSDLLSEFMGSTALPPVLPRLIAHKGLPGGFEVGGNWLDGSLVGLSGFSMLGVGLKWNFFKGPGLPSVAARVSYMTTQLTVDSTVIKASVIKVDGIASQALGPIEPYVGLGFQRASGDFEFSDELMGTLAEGVDLGASKVSPHVFVGLPIKLLILRIAGELDYSLTGITTYAAKATLTF